uniref:CSON013667 protein n=1 Tax=Culicoides sonorensis TaxID=179676 RepID=A0A336LHD2_CULSO
MEHLTQCCVACLSENKSSFSKNCEKLLLEEFLNEKLPVVFVNLPVNLCNGCLFQLEKFKNFKQSVKNSINILSKQFNSIYSCRVVVEPLPMEAINLPIEPITIKLEVSEESFNHKALIEENDVNSSNNDNQFDEHYSEYESASSIEKNSMNNEKPSKSIEKLKNKSKIKVTSKTKESSKNVLASIKKRYQSAKPRERADYNLYCSICKITLEIPPFSKHCMETHFKELENRQWQCKECEKCFSSLSSITNHFKYHRDYEAPRNCDDCDKSFKNMADHYQHSKTHLLFECLDCPATFRSKRLLWPHVLVNHTEGMVCRYCGNKYKTKEKYTKHMKIERYKINKKRREEYKRRHGTKNGKRRGRKIKYSELSEDQSNTNESELDDSLDESKDGFYNKNSQKSIEQELNAYIKTEEALELTAEDIFEECDVNFLDHNPQVPHGNVQHVEENGIKYTVQVVGDRTKVTTQSKGKTTKWNVYIKRFMHILPSRKLESKGRSCAKLDVDCSVCGLEKLYSYRNHIYTKHALIQNDKYICKECNMEFSSSQAMVYHFDVHRVFDPPKACIECGELLHTMSIYKRHMEAHKFTEKVFQCPYRECEKSYCRVTSLQFHYLTVHTGALMCRFCQTVFELKEDYDNHLKAETLARKEKKRLIRYTRIRLAKEKEREDKLKNGETDLNEEEHTQSPVTDLPLVFSRPMVKVNTKLQGTPKLPKNMKFMQPIYCHICRIFCEQYKTHVTETHATKLDTGEYICNICHTCTKYQFSVHFSQMHREFPTIQKCDQCDFSSLQYEPFRKHQMAHKRGRFECNYCGNSYSDKTTIRYHMFFKHTDLFICRFCYKTFEKEDDYKEHMTLEKSKRKPNIKICDICGFTTYHATYMKGHIARVHCNNRNDSVTCEICNRKCKSLLNLKDHIRNAHGTKNEVCPQCGKRFRNQAMLREHIELAHSTKISKCTLCDKEGSDIQLKRHMYLVHDTVKPFVCKICNFSFKLKAGLQKHLHTHAKTRPFNCHLCPQGFYNREVIEKHFIDVHKINYTREQIRQFCKRMPSKYEKEHLGKEEDENVE